MGKIKIKIADKDLSLILDVLVNAWAELEGTAGTYGSGLLSFHIFCDSKLVPEVLRAPAASTLRASTLVAGFISTLAGFLSGSTISTYLEVLFRAADRMTPSSSKRQARMPYTTEILCLLHPHFDLSKPLDAAVWGCLTTFYWSTSRGDEFTVKTVCDRNGFEQTNFFLSRTKSAPHGESVYWAKQNGPTDPKAALANHLSVNKPPPDVALKFSYFHKSSRRPLTKTKFKKRLTKAFSAADIEFIHGRWASDAFSIYLRRHAQIMAPYMQAEAQLHANILRIMIPRAQR
ncbi:hypothetical protein B0H13DRAFT_2236028 [Mycena leptocephala]|nr:hypothetical protein B0H13DRAFT_2236028 [Mycena leptocephala]